ncbi:D-alanyl-D-alanine carboxypeptidase [Rhizobiales bacterium]|uniref:D-alanyl-D-alanine carboxypeptidase family protein n=1 Tax=Hongsoonwoonella zoysiae TaxID=2821844 RepID=UPI001560D38A|nr:D-alanyl-D-alanine carboxypeptidase family protein [Hongsoonwoonella zoysiae]NRG16847.1 D-alanyl-D-alanine carboxypeptidase [Hongsoonwoonella zoysiae]
MSLALSAALLLGPARPALADVASWVVFDVESGRVLDEKDATRQWYPASITKLMTAYVTFKAIGEGRASMQSVVTVSQNAAAEPPSKMGFRPGTKLTVENALKMVLVKSANDIAVALGEAIGGTESGFIVLMNQEAQRMGLSATHFVNPHGLPDNRQVSSARDLGVLARRLWLDFPEHRGLYGHAGLKFGKKTLRSANREFLLRVRGANGLKTGYICNSGYNVAVSATRRGRTVMAVILGAGSGLERLAHSRELIEKGFDERGRGSIEDLKGVSARPPQDGYCKSNPRLSAEELVARYGKNAKRSSAVLSYNGRLEGASGRIIPGVGVSKNSEKAAVPKKGNKIDWAELMDDLIGPRVAAYRPISVSVGVPENAVAVATPAITVVPVAKPGRLTDVKAGETTRDLAKSANPGAILSDEGSDDETDGGEAKPGAIFKGTLAPNAPLPILKPKSP